MDNLPDEELSRLWNMVFNLSRHMLFDEQEAEEATQSIFEKAMLNFSSFQKKSKLSTWLYKVAYNYLIDILRNKKNLEISFQAFEEDVRDFRSYENEFGLSAIEEKLYAQEIKVGCTLALLQCLTPENRFIYTIGTIFQFSHREAASICQMDYDNFRKRLSRAKEKIRSFMNKNCGLINPKAQCHCKKRILIATERGRINPEKILYQTDNKLILDTIDQMNEIDDIARIYQNNPFTESKTEITLMKVRFALMRENP